jgi:cobalamin biosynthesis protein CbiD
MSNNFHSADCALRHGSTMCTCGFVKPRSDKEIIAELRAELDEAIKAWDLAIAEIGKVAAEKGHLSFELDEAREEITMIKINEDYGTLSWSIANKYLASHPKNDVVLAGAKTESQKLDAEDRADEDTKFESEGR